MRKTSTNVEIEQLAKALHKLNDRERQQLWSLLATLEEDEDPGALQALHESEEDVTEGRLYSLK